MAGPTDRERADAAARRTIAEYRDDATTPALRQGQRILDAMGRPIYGALTGIGESIGGAIADDQIEQSRALGQTQTSFAAPGAARAAAQREAAAAPPPEAPQRDALSEGLAALVAGQGGGAAAGPSTATATSSSWQRQSSELDPAVAREMAGKLAAAEAARQQSEREVIAGRDQLDAQARAIRGRLASAADQERQRAGGRATATEQRLRGLDAQLDRMRGELDGQEMQTLGTFSTTGKIMLGLAAALEGFTASQQKRPSNVGAMLQLALNQDSQIQRMNLQRNLERLGATERQRDDALARWRESEAERRQTAERGIALQLGDLAARSKSLDDRMDYATAASEFASRSIKAQVELSAAGRDKTTSSGTKQTAPAGGRGGSGGAAGGGGPSEKVEALVANATGAAKQIESYARQLSKQGVAASGHIEEIKAKMFPSGKDAQLDNQAEALALTALKDPSAPKLNAKVAAALVKTVPTDAHSVADRRRMIGDIYATKLAPIESRLEMAIASRNIPDAMTLGKAREQIIASRNAALVALSRKPSGG